MTDAPITPQAESHEDILRELIEQLNLVFHDDWSYTRAAIVSDELIHDSGTFLQPRVRDEENNWANRARLLEAYRRAVLSLGESR